MVKNIILLMHQKQVIFLISFITLSHFPYFKSIFLPQFYFRPFFESEEWINEIQFNQTQSLFISQIQNFKLLQLYFFLNQIFPYCKLTIFLFHFLSQILRKIVKFNRFLVPFLLNKNIFLSINQIFLFFFEFLLISYFIFLLLSFGCYFPFNLLRIKIIDQEKTLSLKLFQICKCFEPEYKFD
ncbi:hypothetical protein ABPG72_015487 [Tetrahymena utriculariae]